MHHVKLQLRDAFGNSCVASEDVDEPEVAAKLVGFAGVTVQASVAPRGGECTISFQVPSPGQWELQVTISGTEIEDAVAVAARCALRDRTRNVCTCEHMRKGVHGLVN